MVGCEGDLLHEISSKYPQAVRQTFLRTIVRESAAELILSSGGRDSWSGIFKACDPGFSPGILSVRRKTSKSRKFGILNFLVRRINASHLLEINTMQLQGVIKNHPRQKWCPEVDMNHQPSDSLSKLLALAVKPLLHSGMMHHCKQLAFISTDV